MRNKVSIFGVDFLKTSKEDIWKCLEEKNASIQISTINPEFLLQARENKFFREILNSSDLKIVDGIGLWLALKLKGINCSRIAGADLFDELLKIAQRDNYAVCFAVTSKGLSNLNEVLEAARKKYSGIKVFGYEFETEKWNVEQIPNSDFLFCNFGIPHQEEFINSAKKQNKMRCGMGVGGSFDFLTEKIKRAPKPLQIFGLEWVWRMMLQPKRIKKVFRSTILFPVLVIREFINNK